MARPISSRQLQLLQQDTTQPQLRVDPVGYWSPPKGLNLTSRLSRVTPEYVVDVANMMLDDGVLRSRYGTERFDPIENLLQRPSFLSPLFSIVWLRGEFYRNPPGSTIVEAFHAIYTYCPEAVDALEMQCANTFPSGLQPDSGGIWTVQLRDTITEGFPSLAAGAAPGFGFMTVTHGMGVMEPKAFRIRTRKLVGATTWYSPWRYYFAGREGLPADFAIVDNPVNCGVDSVICFPAPGVFVYEYNVNVQPPNFCATPPNVSNASSCAGAGFFAAAWQPFPPLFRQDWSVQMRSTTAMIFSDPLASYNFTLLGRVSISAQSGSGMPLPNPDQSPIQVPA